MNDQVKRYIREVKRELPCSPREKQRCIGELKADISDYLEKKPGATLEELQEAIGSPKTIAKAFMAQLSPEEHSHRLSARRTLVIGIISIVAVLAILIGVLSAVTAYHRNSFYDGYYVDTIEEVSSEIQSDPVPLTVH